MAENSHISWTDNTFNPWMGCTKVSPACQNCYAERDMDHRYKKVAWGPSGTRVKTTHNNWQKPLKWERSQVEYLHFLQLNERGTHDPYTFTADDIYKPRVFCASLADVFEDWSGPIVDAKKQPLYRIPGGKYVTLNPGQFFLENHGSATMDDLRRDLFALIAQTPHLVWLLLTKRPENVERMWHGGLHSNVVLGTSIENQEWAEKRLPYLEAAKRNGLVSKTFVSAEPLVGPIMLYGEKDGVVYNRLNGWGIDWVVTGGESGPSARPCNPDWFRSLRDQSAAAGVPFHFKQWGEFDHTQTRVGKDEAGRTLDGRTHDAICEMTKFDQDVNKSLELNLDSVQEEVDREYADLF